MVDDVGLRDGSISIGASCVTWSYDNGQTVTLAWLDGSIEHDRALNTLRFTSDVTGGQLLINDGDRVDVLGSAVFGSGDYLIAPDSSCPTDVWLVAELTNLRG